MDDINGINNGREELGTFCYKILALLFKWYSVILKRTWIVIMYIANSRATSKM